MNLQQLCQTLQLIGAVFVLPATKSCTENTNQLNPKKWLTGKSFWQKTDKDDRLMQRSLGALNTDNVCAVMEQLCNCHRIQIQAQKFMLYVINSKCSLWSILELIGSVKRTRVLYCQILFNSCCAGDRQSDWLHRLNTLVCVCASGFIFYSWCLFHLWLIFPFSITVIWFSFLIHCDLCFSVTTALVLCFPLAVDLWALPGIK